MDLTDRRNPFNNLLFPPPPPPYFTSPIFPRQSSSSATNFPILAIAIIGILAIVILLISYYIFVIKCCLNWHQINIFRRRRNQNPLMIYSPHEVNKGLEESVIRAIPVFKFKKREDQNKNTQECSVCLNEFQEDEKLKIIPNCCHIFHIDCIDTWLQGNTNCPLCRTSVSCDTSLPLDLISSSPNHEPLRGEDDFVVIELGSSRDRDFLEEQERVTPRLNSPSHKKERKFPKVRSMGDECINTRGKNEQFGEIQAIRRSISMDSSVNRRVYLAVQEEINRRKEEVQVARDGGGSTEDSSRSSSSGGGNERVMKRCFFSFGSKSSRSSSILPLYLEP